MTTTLYDRKSQTITLDAVERIATCGHAAFRATRSRLTLVSVVGFIGHDQRQHLLPLELLDPPRRRFASVLGLERDAHRNLLIAQDGVAAFAGQDAVQTLLPGSQLRLLELLTALADRLLAERGGFIEGAHR